MLARHPAGNTIASSHDWIRRRGGNDIDTGQLGQRRSGRWITDRSHQVQAPRIQSLGAAWGCTLEI